ncbi:MAG TPA: phosphonoacetaldehyde hydrolase [Caulobacteraceae bacterium]
MSYPIKAVIFDWAGTMVDFGCMAPIEALIDAFAAHSLAITAADARHDMGRAKHDHIQAILGAPAIASAWAAATGAAPTPADSDAIYQTLEPLMEAAATRCADLIPGAAAVATDLLKLGVKIGSGTGYTRQMMSGILPRAAAQGYAPAVVVCAGETPSGRPAPLMTWKALIALDAWPAQACVKVDDATVGIEEGRLAGCWTIGLAASGNGVGLSLHDYSALAELDRLGRVAAAAEQLRTAGANYVIDTVADIRPVLEEIAARIESGQRPPTA